MTSVTKVKLPPASLYQKTPVYDVDSTIVFGLMRPPVLPAASDRLMTVTQGDEHRLDRLAVRAVGDARYWWMIALVNGMVDPLTEAVTGRVLRVPANLNAVT